MPRRIVPSASVESRSSPEISTSARRLRTSPNSPISAPRSWRVAASPRRPDLRIFLPVAARRSDFRCDSKQPWRHGRRGTINSISQRGHSGSHGRLAARRRRQQCRNCQSERQDAQRDRRVNNSFVVQGNGTVLGSFGNLGGGIVTPGAPGSVLTIGNLTGNALGGQLVAAYNTTLQTNGAYDNLGVVFLGGGNAEFSGSGEMTNLGTLNGAGTVSKSCTHGGTIEAQGGTLSLTATGNSNTPTARFGPAPEPPSAMRMGSPQMRAASC